MVLNNTRCLWLFSSFLSVERRSEALRLYSAFSPFLGSSTLWMLGSTPPAAMVTLPSSWREQRASEKESRGVERGAVWARALDSSSSLRMASWMWRGIMLRGRASSQRTAVWTAERSPNAPRLLVVARRVASQLQHLGAEVLQHGGQVDGRARADAGGVPAGQAAFERRNEKERAQRRRGRAQRSNAESTHLPCFR